MKQFKITTPSGDITIKSDPTLGSREFRIEQSPSTTCARCSHTFTSRPDGFVEAEIAAHQERCVIVGDYVRWSNPNNHYGNLWVEGELAVLAPSTASIRAGAGTLTQLGSVVAVGLHCAPLRRIPRPQQGEVVTTCPGYNAVFTIEPDPPDLQARQARRVVELYVAEAKHIAATPLPEHHAARIRAMAERCRQPAPVLYDGLTAEQCLERDRQRRQEDSTSAWRSHVRPSADQRAVVSAHWSAQLRAKLAASDEAERCRVRVDLQCDEDEPW